ncbi:MAG: glycosyltransferase family 4 protein [Clostridium septicum]|uniref:glycosyltransferase family 4 protein n=1 Tax=Clostridium septicum TaxID=1504 RepID=UPI00258701DA|nr:glycosyltransferase family 4 protein [Clostridium septicum]MDU1312961.1 glycosyltransferase family 4 protein [Clostridium septicum]
MGKILVISFSNLPNFQSNLYNTYKNIKDLGNEVYTIGSEKIRGTGINLEKNNYIYKLSENPMPTLKSIKLMMNSLEEITKKIEEINPKYIHFISKHTWNYFLIKKIKKRLKNSQIIHSFHDPIGHTGEIRRYGVILYNKLIGQNVDSIIVHSDKSKMETEKYIKPKCNVYKIALGEMQWNEFVPNKEVKKNILVFGRINPYKGCDLIPYIAEELKKRNSDIKITIAGKTSKDLSEDVINKIQECENVKFINKFIDDNELSNYFYESDMVLITYRSITQSSVILQAYRHSKPIIAFNIDGIAEFLEESKTALLSEPFNIEYYVDNILHLYDNLEELNKCSYEAWEFGKNNFSNGVMVKELLEIYKIGEK